MENNVKVIMSEEDAAELVYMDWDVEETKMVLPKLFPNATSIKYITAIDYDSIIVSVDGKRYEVSFDGNVTECKEN